MKRMVFPPPVLQTDSRLRDDTAYISDVALHPAQPFKS